MKVNWYFVIVVAIFSGCSDNAPKNTSTLEGRAKTELTADSNLAQLKKMIDSLASDTNSLIVYAKVPNSKKLIPIKHGKFPDVVETSYNLLKDRDGQVIYILEAPFSESGDWDIVYRSYFDKEGKLFAFERKAGFFNSICTDDAAHETLIKYYDHDFSVVDSTYTLTDNDKKPLKKSECIFNYNHPYIVYKTVNSYLNDSALNGL